MGSKYKFDSIEDMIELAEYIQSRVYWGYSYYISDNLVDSNKLWSIIKEEYSENGATGLIINNEDIIFLYDRG